MAKANANELAEKDGVSGEEVTEVGEGREEVGNNVLVGVADDKGL